MNLVSQEKIEHPPIGGFTANEGRGIHSLVETLIARNKQQARWRWSPIR
jgi:hypothetical protein